MTDSLSALMLVSAAMPAKLRAMPTPIAAPLKRKFLISKTPRFRGRPFSASVSSFLPTKRSAIIEARVGLRAWRRGTHGVGASRSFKRRSVEPAANPSDPVSERQNDSWRNAYERPERGGFCGFVAAVRIDYEQQRNPYRCYKQLNSVPAVQPVQVVSVHVAENGRSSEPGHKSHRVLDVCADECDAASSGFVHLR
jgi:hypothetical protein